MIKKSHAGLMLIVLGLLSLGDEIYNLKFIQIFECIAGKPYKENAFEYLNDWNILIPIMIDIIIIIIGMVLIADVLDKNH